MDAVHNVEDVKRFFESVSVGAGLCACPEQGQHRVPPTKKRKRI